MTLLLSFQNDGTEKEKNLSEASPKTQTSPSEPKDQNALCQKQQMSNLDLNENYNNKLSAATAKSESGQSLTPSLPISPASDCCAAPRIERKLSIEIKKVPLQEGPRSFDTSSSMGVAAAAGGGSANSGSMLQRCHAFKARSGQSLLTSSSSLSEDSGTEGGAGGCGESQADGGVLARPNHLPVKSDGGDRAELKAGHAAWAQPCGSPEKPFPKTTSSDRVAPSSSSSSHLSSSSSSSSSTPVRTALSFTNPLHSDNSDDEGDGEMSAGGEGYRTSVSTATVTALHFGDHQLLRKVSPMSIAGQSSSSPAAATASTPITFRLHLFVCFSKRAQSGYSPSRPCHAALGKTQRAPPPQ